MTNAQNPGKRRPDSVGVAYRRAIGADALAIALILSLAFLLFLGERRAAGIPVLWSTLAPGGSALLGMTLLIGLLKLCKARVDGPWLVAWLFLMGMGTITQQRLRPEPPQGLWSRDVWLPLAAMGSALFVYLLFRNGRFRILRRLGWLYALASLAIVGLLFAYGARYRGAFYGPGLITPTEPIKVTVALLWAAFLTNRRGAFLEGARPWGLPRFEIYMPATLFAGVLAAGLAAQRDLGMITILGLVALCGLSFASGKYWHWFLIALGIATLWQRGLGWFPHGAQRIEAWLHPFEDPTNSGWQILQGLSGMYAGGFWGAGLGIGEPERVPTVSTDFVYAALGEELGFLGSAVTVLAFGVLASRGLSLSRRVVDPFGRLASGLLIVTLGIQAVLNLGGVTKAIPLTGVPLPFVSHGGASLLTSCVAVGLILAMTDPWEPHPSPRKKRQRPQRDGGPTTETTKRSGSKKARAAS